VVEQLSLFPSPEEPPAPPASTDTSATTPAPTTRLTPRSTLGEALEEFEPAMRLKGFTDNTIQAFRADLRILAGFLHAGRPIGEISTKDLGDFLAYLLHARGRPCNAKSYARRLTALKVFFAWLAQVGARPGDPAAALTHQPVTTPLPRILSEAEIEQLLAAAGRLAAAAEPDPRPLLLLQLLLHTGMKKGECMGIHLAHIDAIDPQQPVVHIRYNQARQRHKERTLRLPPAIVPTLRAYRERYRPAEFLFECTPRNLEYVLRDRARLAGVAGALSFESLRWTAALRDYREGMAEEALRRKLGLSKLRWRETLEKLERLAEPAL